MANIKQQKKRNRRSLTQRERNLRYRSTIKTLFRRLDEAAESGDGAQIAERARELEHLIDRAAAEGVIHRNNAARKKSRLARISQGRRPAARSSFLRPAPACRRAPGRAGPAPRSPGPGAPRRPVSGRARAGR